ncbi:cell surface glycoprotein 1-like isoform X1 [Amphibalanus amphitrite]|uniref:cell surface glycoprotein 1-like isoform X1 n=1 Tax=Amphibalanus amphitrite TaxID=1232801 RepID=UPI001C8FAB69|nr:cell surface glycoprotein 1-like isoform X1 [Amphibalanus amphitrite]XP_043215014.1 cell surface glycoprotein 1-like isoform X1 [Amphibalanus amphitrite]
MCDVLAPEEVFEDCLSSSEDEEIYEDCPTPEDCRLPADDRTSPAGDWTSPAGDCISQAGERTSPVHNRTSPVQRQSSPAEDRISPLQERISSDGDRVRPTEDRTSPAEDPISPAQDRTSPAEDRTSSAGAPTSSPTGRSSPAEDRTTPAEDRTSPVEDRLSPSEDLAGPGQKSTDSVADRLSSVEDTPSPDADVPCSGESPASEPASHSSAVDVSEVATPSDEPAAAADPSAPAEESHQCRSEPAPPAEVAPDGVGRDLSVSEAPAAPGVAGQCDWDESEGDERPRASQSSEADSSESGSTPETMARSWHVLESSEPAAAATAGSPLDEAAPRPAGAAPDMAQLADAVADSQSRPASDSERSPDDSERSPDPSVAADAPAATGAAARDSDDDAELMADPDAVDEAALRQLDEQQTEEEREERRQRAALLKADGNQLYAAAAYDAARERYTAALQLCPLAAGAERAVMFSNRAACRARADDEAGALADCSRALELDPGYARPLQRRAEIYERTERLDEALEDWKRLLELRPDCGEARRAVTRLPPLIAERNEKLKSEMLGKLKELGNMFMRPFGLSTDNFQMEQNEAGGYSVKFKPT